MHMAVAMKLLSRKDNYIAISARLHPNQWMHYEFNLNPENKNIDTVTLKDIITRIEVEDSTVQKVSHNGDHRNYMVNGIYVNVQPKKHRRKSPQKHVCEMVAETQADYEYLVRPFITLPDWVRRIFDGTAKGEVIFMETEDYYLMPDFKWNQRQEDLYLLVLFKSLELKSMRDLTSDHIELLETADKTVKEYIFEQYNLEPQYIRSFLHYHPSTWQLHIHYQHISAENALGGNTQIGRAHLLSQVIYNLRLDGNYYKNATLTYIRKC